jgi:hypothetical protein
MNNYFINEPIEGYYCKFIDMGYEYPVLIMHHGKIGKAKNGRTIGINEKGEITDIMTASFIAKGSFKRYLKCDKSFFNVLEHKANVVFKKLEDDGYIEEMRRIEEFNNITAQDYEWAGIKVDELN